MVLEQLRRVSGGAAVVGNDGSKIGAVQEVHEDYLLVKGGLLVKHDLYVPVDAVRSVNEDNVTLNVASGDVADLGWRFPPDRGITRGADASTAGGAADEPTDLTTMTGAGYGTGTGPAAGGPLGPGHGDAIADRFGGSARAGLSGLNAGPEDALEPMATGETAASGAAASDDVDASDELDDDDTSEGTSEGTSEDTSEGTSEDDEPAAADAPPLT